MHSTSNTVYLGKLKDRDACGTPASAYTCLWQPPCCYRTVMYVSSPRISLLVISPYLLNSAHTWPGSRFHSHYIFTVSLCICFTQFIDEYHGSSSATLRSCLHVCFVPPTALWQMLLSSLTLKKQFLFSRNFYFTSLKAACWLCESLSLSSCLSYNFLMTVQCLLRLPLVLVGSFLSQPCPFNW